MTSAMESRQDGKESRGTSNDFGSNPSSNSRNHSQFLDPGDLTMEPESHWEMNYHQAAIFLEVS